MVEIMRRKKPAPAYLNTWGLFEDYSDVGFAVILMTPDDVGGLKGQEQKDRVRQNVVFELGYFIGKLGRNRVMALVDGDIETPTDETFARRLVCILFVNSLYNRELFCIFEY